MFKAAYAIKYSQRVFLLFRFLVPFAFFLVSIYSYAASSDTITPLITYKHFGEEDGLHCKTVYEAIQDKEGFMWFATDAGVFRFDGKVFRQFNVENGVTDKEVLKIFQDSYGRIWFLTLNGHLSFWRDGKIYNPSNTPFLKKASNAESIFSYFEDTHRRIWLGTTAHTYIVIDADSVRLIKCPYQGYTDEVRLGSIYIHEDADGNMWTFSERKMFRFPDNKVGDTLLIPQPVVDNYLCRRNKSSEIFYIPRVGGIYKISDKSVSLYAEKKEILFEDKIINIVYDEGNLWICTRGNGCYEMVNGKISERYFEHSVITSIFRDRENNLWFNSMGEGVYMLPFSAHFVKNYNKQGGLCSSNVTSFALGGKGQLWLGFNNGSVQKIEKNKATRYMPERPGPGEPDFNRVVSLAVDSDVVFCGTDIGAYFIDEGEAQFVQFDTTPGHSSYSVKHLFIDKDGDVYTLHSSGLLRIIKTHNGYYAKEILDSLVRTFAAVQYPDGHLLISVPSGIAEYTQRGKLINYETDADFSSTRILDMKLAPGNLLVLATNGNGIYLLKGKKVFQHLTVSDGISDNNCKRIFVSDNILYVATDKGLNVLLYKNEKWRFAEVITTNDALLSNTVNDAAEREGNIYVATEKGFSEINKEIIFREKFIGKVYITEIVTDSVRAVTDTACNFKADVSRILMKFSYPVFDPSNDLKVSYRLVSGSDDNAEWTSSENNEVEFSSLSPGKYIFQLKPDVSAISAAGITNLYINIIPLWWQTTAARTVFALIIVVLIALIVKGRTQVQYKKRLRQLALLEAERSRIASDMHDDIGADLTQISIWSGIFKSSKDENVLERITNSSNDVLQKMEQIIWALNSSHNRITDLVSYLREYASQYLESADIKLLFEISETMPGFEISAIQKRNVFLTIKELLHNTVKHSGAKTVNIKIYHANSMLHIEYEDDGQGFTPKLKESGMGNITIQKRMEEISSSLSVKSAPGKGFQAHLRINLTADNGSIKKLPDTFAANHD